MISVVCVFFNDTATTEIYTLSLHDALPISCESGSGGCRSSRAGPAVGPPAGVAARVPVGLLRPHEAVGHAQQARPEDRKSTRLNSSHANISYAVFCLKKKKQSAGRQS